MELFWTMITIFAGLIIGFGTRHFLGPNKPRVPVFLLDDVISWICQGDRNRTMSAIVNRVFGGKVHLHLNPVKKKAPEKYPTSER